ncbi:MAG TPA: proton-conducting transporter membrane subunit [Bryobacteraceae bacterium]|nr:proton-conducting transporter membrane subunit [Bryobacteraceae bacterium]
MSLSQALLVFIVMAPGAVFVALASLWLLGWVPSERVLSVITGLTFAACLLGLAGMLWMLATTHASAVTLTFGSWFAVHEYRFPLVLVADHLSLPFLAMTVVLSGLIGQFSATYLHRESGFFRFFALLHLFAFGSLLAFAAGSFDLLIAGWELVGITSVLLIAFFDRRPAPVENGLRVFGIYRACDIGLLLGVFALHNWAGNGSFAAGMPHLAATQATVVCLLLLLAAAGKGAQIPFSGWLPRAMEGPTPSSAIFYGAISIHAGAYLLLRAQPLLAEAPVASIAVIVTGVATAVYGTMAGRASADVKTSLAFASLTQVGVIFVEIGFGWKSVAIAHVLGHALVRTLQFLRAPSMLHDYRRMRSAMGGDVSYGRAEDLLPDRVSRWLYRWAFDRGHLDTILDRWFIHPLYEISRLFTKLDGIGIAARSRQATEPAISLPSHAEREVE